MVHTETQIAGGVVSDERNLEERLQAIRAYVQDCIENGHDRAALANLYGARDEIDGLFVLVCADDYNRSNLAARWLPATTSFALELMLTGGNHLARVLIKNVGRDFSDRFPWNMAAVNAWRVLRADDYDVWCCWSAIMRARDLIKETP